MTRADAKGLWFRDCAVINKVERNGDTVTVGLNFTSLSEGRLEQVRARAQHALTAHYQKFGWVVGDVVKV